MVVSNGDGALAMLRLFEIKVMLFKMVNYGMIVMLWLFETVMANLIMMNE